MYQTRRGKNQSSLFLILLTAVLAALAPATAFSDPTPPAVCGNGKVEAPEQCDDGNTQNGDGCSADCLTIENGWTCNLEMQCKNNQLELGEQCDPTVPGTIPGTCTEGCSSVINFSDVTAFTYKIPTFTANAYAAGPANWHIAPDNRSVSVLRDGVNSSGFLVLNNEPVFTSNEKVRVLELSIEKTNPNIKVDDDYIGIAFGITANDLTRPLGSPSPADYVLLQWNSENPAGNSANFGLCGTGKNGDSAKPGLVLARVQGVPTVGQLWARNANCAENEAGKYTILGENGTTYRVNDNESRTLKVIYTPTRIILYVDGVYQYEVKGRFPETGNLGLFVLAQDNVKFQLLEATKDYITKCLPICGDGIVTGLEQCDDGVKPPVAGDGCDQFCRIEPGWTCDQSANCQTVCGDGIVAGTETCDDGNNTANDGCSADCTTVESGWTCNPTGGNCLKLKVSQPGNGTSIKPQPLEPSGTFNGPVGRVYVTVTNSYGVVVCEGKADSFDPIHQTWSKTDCGFNLNDGTYTIVAVGVEENGAFQTDTQTTFTVDSVPPTIDIAGPAKKSVTNQKSVPIHGTTEGAKVVKIKVTKKGGGNTPVCSESVAPENGSWELNGNCELPENGDYIVTATAIDAAGNETEVTSELTYDDAAPSLSIDSPINNSHVKTTKTTLTGKTEPGAKVTVEITDKNGSPIKCEGEVTVENDGTWTITDCQTEVEGEYTVTVKATDAAQNKSQIESVFVVDTTPPTVDISEPSNNAKTNKKDTTITGRTEPNTTVLVTVTDANGVEVCGAQIPSKDGNWTLPNCPTIVDGTYNIKAVAMDEAGNEAQTTSSFDVDTKPPTFDIVGPAHNAQLDSKTFDVFGNIETDGNSTVKVTVTRLGGVLCSNDTNTVTVNNGKWELENCTVSDNGEYVIEVVVTDEAGNETTKTRRIKVNNNVPGVSVIDPIHGTVTKNKKVTISGKGSEGGDLVVKVYHASSSTVVKCDYDLSTIPATEDWEFECDLGADAEDGIYTIVASVTKNGKTTTTDKSTFRLDSVVPRIEIQGPEKNQTIENPVPQIKGKTDTDVDEVVVIVKDADGTEVCKQKIYIGAAIDWLLPGCPLKKNGKYTISATATDEAGNTTTSESSFTLNVPGPDVEVDVVDTDGSVEKPTTTVTGTVAANTKKLKVVVTDENGNTVEGVELTDKDGNKIQDGTVTPDENGKWSVNVSGLTNGKYKVTATATGEFENHSEDSKEFTVKLPDFTANAVADDSGKVTVTGTASPGTKTVVVTIGDKTETVEVDKDGNWTATFENVSPGTHEVVATPKDANGDDTEKPLKPKVRVPGFTANATVDDPKTGKVTVTGIASPGTKTVVVTIGDKTETAEVDGDGNWSVSFEDVSPGDHNVTAQQKDTSGQDVGSPVESPINIPSQPGGPGEPGEPDGPVEAASVSITSAKPSAENDGSIIVKGKANPNATVTVELGSKTKTIQADANGDWSVTFEDVEQGSYVIKAKSGDKEDTFNFDYYLELIMGGCSAAPSSPAEGLLPFLLGGFGLFLLRRRKE